MSCMQFTTDLERSEANSFKAGKDRKHTLSCASLLEGNECLLQSGQLIEYTFAPYNKKCNCTFRHHAERAGVLVIGRVCVFIANPP